MASEDRPLKAWERGRESAEKLDYFMLGMSSALTAYIGQHLPTTTLGLNAGSLEYASLAAFSLSVVAGIERVRAGVAGLSAQQVQLEASGMAGAMRTMLVKKPTSGAIDEVSGRTYTPAEVVAKIAHEDKRTQAADRQWERWKKRGERAYRWRDYLLFLGVLTYAAGKIWSALP
jgi:hypothetical protein